MVYASTEVLENSGVSLESRPKAPDPGLMEQKAKIRDFRLCKNKFPFQETIIANSESASLIIADGCPVENFI